MRRLWARITWQDVGLVAASVAIIGAGIYIFWR